MYMGKTKGRKGKKGTKKYWGGAASEPSGVPQHLQENLVRIKRELNNLHNQVVDYMNRLPRREGSMILPNMASTADQLEGATANLQRVNEEYARALEAIRPYEMEKARAEWKRLAEMRGPRPPPIPVAPPSPPRGRSPSKSRPKSRSKSRS